jgi:hypothetical protein
MVKNLIENGKKLICVIGDKGKEEKRGKRKDEKKGSEKQRKEVKDWRWGKAESNIHAKK